MGSKRARMVLLWQVQSHVWFSKAMERELTSVGCVHNVLFQLIPIVARQLGGRHLVGGLFTLLLAFSEHVRFFTSKAAPTMQTKTKKVKRHNVSVCGVCGSSADKGKTQIRHRRLFSRTGEARNTLAKRNNVVVHKGDHRGGHKQKYQASHSLNHNNGQGCNKLHPVQQRQLPKPCWIHGHRTLPSLRCWSKQASGKQSKEGRWIQKEWMDARLCVWKVEGLCVKEGCACVWKDVCSAVCLCLAVLCQISITSVCRKLQVVAICWCDCEISQPRFPKPQKNDNPKKPVSTPHSTDLKLRAVLLPVTRERE